MRSININVFIKLALTVYYVMSQRLWPKHNDNNAFDIMYSKAGVFHKLEKN